jgi:hypothetical protein
LQPTLGGPLFRPLVGDARRRRREPRPPLAVALEFIVRYQLLQKLERLLEMAEPLPPAHAAA